VVQPWLADERAQSLTSTVNGKPRLKKLVAFFPDNPQPITLKYKQAATGEDVAVCTIDPKDLPPKAPVLPLEKDSDTVAIGRIVVTMGYPSGPDRLLAMLPEDEARGIQNRYGSTESLLAYLGQTKRIRPLMTQGNITDLDARRIVYDARTGEGGSGGPLFGPPDESLELLLLFLPRTLHQILRCRFTSQSACWKSPDGPRQPS